MPSSVPAETYSVSSDSPIAKVRMKSNQSSRPWSSDTVMSSPVLQTTAARANPYMPVWSTLSTPWASSSVVTSPMRETST